MCIIPLRNSSDSSWFDVKYLHVSGIPTDRPYYCYYCQCGLDNYGGLVTECTDLGIMRPPKGLDNRTTVLNFQGNEFHRIKSYHFAGLTNLRILDLSRNAIDRIDVNAFDDLTNLEQLFLHDQTLCKRCTYILEIGVFKGLNSLRTLTLHGTKDSFHTRSWPMPVQVLLDLTSLEKLSIDGVPNVRFDSRFKALTNLSSIYSSGKTGSCEIQTLTPFSFTGVPNLRNLTLEKCNIDTISTTTFNNLLHLNYLDLSMNIDITFDQFADFSCSLVSRELAVLKINSIYNPNRAGTELRVNHMRCVQNSTLEEIHMDENGIASIETGVFCSFPITLKRLYMRRNKIEFKLAMFRDLLSYPELEVFGAGDQLIVERSGRLSQITHFGGFRFRRQVDNNASDKTEPTIDQYEAVHARLAELGTEMPAINSSLKVMICSGSYSDIPVNQILKLVGDRNVMEYLDLSRNFIPLLRRETFGGLSKLKFLNVSTNYIEHTSDNDFNIFKGLGLLEVLDLSKNMLGDLLRQDVNGDIFSSLKELRHLNLSSNRIYRQGTLVFRGVHNLETLDLSDNSIETLDCDFDNMIRLRKVNLANNRLQTLPVTVRDALSRIVLFHPVQIELTQNKLACNCENIPLLEWLFTSKIRFANKDAYTCIFNNQSTASLNGSIDSLLQWLRDDCKSYQDVIIACSIGCGILFAIAVSSSVYINRWKLRYWYYMAKVRLDLPHRGDQGQDHFVYDVFLSYGDGDRQLVTKDIVDNLEKDLNLRLNIRDRDFEIGEMIAVNISKAIKQSRKTFLLVSRHFLANKWCNFEMNMAKMEETYQQRKVLVILFVEPIPMKRLPIGLMNLLKEKPSMELPENVELRFPFWQKCKEYAND